MYNTLEMLSGILYNYSDRTKLISYTYNAWGQRNKTYHNNGMSSPANYNPFMYRGYYYDTDLEMYYLNARY